MSLDDFELVVDVHLKGTWLGTRAASLVMREQGRGKIGNPGQTNYSAAKAGIVGMTKAAAKEREVPMGRAGEPVEVANAVLFLASDLASYITGTVVEISGGRGI